MEWYQKMKLKLKSDQNYTKNRKFYKRKIKVNNKKLKLPNNNFIKKLI